MLDRIRVDRSVWQNFLQAVSAGCLETTSVSWELIQQTSAVWTLRPTARPQTSLAQQPFNALRCGRGVCFQCCAFSAVLSGAFNAVLCGEVVGVGSLIVRPCRYAQVTPQLCAPHRMATALQPLTRGEPTLPGATPASVLRDARRVLTLHSVEGSREYTLKSFRAGRATSLAAAGWTFHTYAMEAGEWKSMAVLRYIDTDAVDLTQAFQIALRTSDDEDEE